MKSKHWIVAIVPIVSIILDQWTKGIIVDRFQLGESIPVLSSFFNITYVRNTGAAFGFMATVDSSLRIPFFLIVPTIALLVIAYLFRKLPAHDVKTAWALSLVMGGAIGNLIDRVKYGYVVDFLDFHWKYQAHFPAFNVADSAICIGVGLLMLDIAGHEEKERNVSSAA
jgi:signal peptidase II